MDTSETFIKMCDCEEIQAQRENNVYYGGEYVADWRGDKITGVSYHPQLISTVAAPYKLTWLPRQDQLQKMVKNKYPINYATDLGRWVKAMPTSEWNKDCSWSMEQLWLAFVMSEKYKKVWDGETWILTREVANAGLS